MGQALTTAQVDAAAKLVDVTIADLNLATAVRLAVRHYNARRDPATKPATTSSNPQFLERITVNYLRHVCSNYDAHRDFLRRIPPGQRARAGAIIKGRVLARIATSYPPLAAEARRQAQREDSKR